MQGWENPTTLGVIVFLAYVLGSIAVQAINRLVEKNGRAGSAPLCRYSPAELRDALNHSIRCHEKSQEMIDKLEDKVDSQFGHLRQMIRELEE